MASPYDIDIRTPPFNAAGDGQTNDTDAFRKAIAAASLRRHGGRIYLPPGEYLLFASPADKPLRIEHSNITIFGDGPQSILFIAPPWRKVLISPVRDPDSDGYVIIGKQAGGAIANIHIQNLRVRSIYDDSAVLYAPDAPTFLFHLGTPQTLTAQSPKPETGVVHNSGFSDILAENLGGGAFGFGGGDNLPDSGNQSRNNYVIRTIIRNCAYQAINPFSGGHTNTLFAHNVIDGNAGIGIEGGGQGTLITNNIISRARQGGLAWTNDPQHQAWTVIANNTFFECGDSNSETASPSIQLGESLGAWRVMILNNVVRRAYGNGIVAVGGSTRGDAPPSDLVIRGNVIDEFGVNGTGRSPGFPNVFAGIFAINYVRVIVTDNIVRAGSGPNDKSDVGIGTGGGSAVDCWTHGNTTIGNFTGQAIATPQSAGATPPLLGTHVRIGMNYDIPAGRPSPGYDARPAPHIPVLPVGPNDPIPSVAGSDVWLVSQPGTTVTGFSDGYLGQTITVIFLDNAAVFDPAAGNLALAGVGLLNPTAQDTLSFVCDVADFANRRWHWIETARSIK